VDGSHIRTLLLTFFFRHMEQLIRRGKVYIAQPPLYQIVKAKSARYVLNDKVMHDTLTELGLEDSVLEVREAERAGAVTRRLEGSVLRRAVRLLRRLHELVEIAERRGVRFPDLLGARSGDPEGRNRLPTHRLTWRGGEAWAWSERDARRIAEERGLVPGEGVEAPNGHAAEQVSVRELHENRELERLFADLGEQGLDIDHYATVQEESASGDRLPARFAWVTTARTAKLVGPRSPEGDEGAEQEGGAGETPRARTVSDGRVVEAPNLASVLGALHEIGRRGLEIKRFKGLGEMDASQLWETTMDPARRTLVRVNMDAASEAERLFTTLMGEEVEPRRRYIEDHALEVRNLDV
jgi:DNA gyrase subunit B